MSYSLFLFDSLYYLLSNKQILLHMYFVMFSLFCHALYQYFLGEYLVLQRAIVVHQIRKYSSKAIARAGMLLQLSTYTLALHTLLVFWEKTH